MNTIERPDWRRIYIQRYYESKPGWKEHFQYWLDLIIPRVARESTILEIGGGPIDSTTQILRPYAKRLVGLDVDPVIRGNSFLDAAVVYDGRAFTELANSEFDLV